MTARRDPVFGDEIHKTSFMSRKRGAISEDQEAPFMKTWSEKRCSYDVNSKSYSNKRLKVKKRKAVKEIAE